MEFDRVVAERRSNRRFKPDPLSDDQISQILEAARLAPSGSNVQPWRFVVVKSSDMRARLSVVSPFGFVFKAPVVFVCCADRSAIEKRDQRISELVELAAFEDIEMEGDIVQLTSGRTISSTELRISLTMNVAIAVEHMALKAADLGLGSCWIGGFDAKETKRLLGLGEDIFPTILLPVGVPVNDPSPRPRLTMEEIVIETV
ncbi:MAG: oxidoreductase [bacterium]|nr:oxidoreductase [bacterium]